MCPPALHGFFRKTNRVKLNGHSPETAIPDSLANSCNSRRASMPLTFESFGLKFLYPDNWVISTRAPDEGDDGLTLELPSGGFLSIEVDDGELTDADLLERVADAIREDYEDVESEEVSLAGAGPDESAVDFRFFYLDLLVVSRAVILTLGKRRLLIQFQAESRDFDANETVVDAILQQLRAQPAER